MAEWLKTRLGKNKQLQQTSSVISGPAAIQALDTAIKPLSDITNRYDLYREFLRIDPEANNAINRLALLVQYAYKGCMVHVAQTLTDDEKNLVKTANLEAELLNFRSRFFYVARHILRDGDEVFVSHFENSIGVRQIQPLPISKLTAVEEEEQLGNANAQIFYPVIYALNENDASKRLTFPQANQKVYHVSFSNEAEEVIDNMNRYTFGVWSESSIESLRSRILWKQAILIADILWRYRNVPREVHEIDTSHNKPELFTGDTIEARLTAYQTAVRSYLSAYATEIQKKKVDQGYVIIKGNKIFYVEPKRVAYTSPNELNEQLNESIREGLGWHKAGTGTFATELVEASYVILLPDLIAYKIKKALLPLLHEHLRLKYSFTDEQLSKIDLNMSLVLDILRGEVVRQIAVLSAARTHTKDELRAKLGDEPLTQQQREEIASLDAAIGRQPGIQSTMDMIATADRQREPSTPITPESRRDKQQT